MAAEQPVWGEIPEQPDAEELENRGGYLAGTTTQSAAGNGSSAVAKWEQLHGDVDEPAYLRKARFDETGEV